jgi:tetratricopeptide (TPR) repeat protein
MKRSRTALLLAALAAMGLVPTSARADRLPLPPEAQSGLARLYSGDPDAAIEFFRQIQQQQPEHPLGYLLEVEARWWKLYCAACEIKWGMIDAWKRPKLREDSAYFALTQKAIHLAEAQLARNESAEMHLYAGLGWTLEARLYGLRDERRATARTAVKAREQFLRALQLDPQLADAYTGLGLYNYYIDTLSPIVKLLRFFMGIPGGSKREGIRQLQIAIDQGELTAVEARFYLAKCLRNYDRKYEQAATLTEPLVRDYPQNPLFQLLLGNLNAELSRNEKAASSFRAVEQLPIPDPACADRARALAQQLLATLPASPGQAQSLGNRLLDFIAAAFGPAANAR